MNINFAVISGNLTRDAQVRRTASGMAIVSFTVAVNERRKNNQTGEWDNYTNYIDVTWFGNYAEKCAASLVKGTPVAVGAKLRWSQWEREGQKHSKTELIVDRDAVMLPPKPQGQFAPPQQNRAAQNMQVPSFVEVYDEDIPF